MGMRSETWSINLGRLPGRDGFSCMAGRAPRNLERASRSYALGNHSKFVRPGAAIEGPIFIGAGTTRASMSPWVTLETDNLVSKSAVPVSGGSFTVSLGAKSVTSFVSDSSRRT